MFRIAVFGSTCTAILMGVGFIPRPDVASFPEFSMPEISLPEAPAILADMGELSVDLPEFGKRLEERVLDAITTPTAATSALPATASASVPATPQTDKLVIANTVNFDLDADNLDDAAQTKLATLADWMRDNPSARIGIFGHTDLTGSDAYNNALGQRRADSVASFLVETGVTKDRISIVMSYGETDPLIETDETSRDNRRVLIKTM